MKIISIDQATIKTGVAIFENKKLVNHYLINLANSKNPADKRLEEMMTSVKEVIESERPDVVLFENVAYQSNVQTLIVLARLQGSIIQTCINNNIEYKIISPQEWRTKLDFITGRGCKREFLKNQAKLYVKIHYKETVSEDEADAICIAASYIIKGIDRIKNDSII